MIAIFEGIFRGPLVRKELKPKPGRRRTHVLSS
jgi:hypothetical protein